MIVCGLRDLPVPHPTVKWRHVTAAHVVRTVLALMSRYRATSATVHQSRGSSSDSWHGRQVSGPKASKCWIRTPLLERCASYFSQSWDHFPLVVGPVGLEPTTYGLKVRSSAN